LANSQLEKSCRQYFIKLLNQRIHVVSEQLMQKRCQSRMALS